LLGTGLAFAGAEEDGAAVGAVIGVCEVAGGAASLAGALAGGAGLAGDEPVVGVGDFCAA
jgi:hypothetical protein